MLHFFISKVSRIIENYFSTQPVPVDIIACKIYIYDSTSRNTNMNIFTVADSSQ